MPKIVEVPGLGNVEFPDNMSDDAISQALQSQTGSAPAPTKQRAIPVPGGGFIPERQMGSFEERMGRSVGSVALPVAGGAAGTVIGSTMGGAGAIPGAMIGSALGTAASQALGFEEPSATNVAISGAGGALPIVGRVVGSALKPLARFVPGLSAVKLHDIAQKAPGAMEDLIKTIPVSPLWEGVRKAGGTKIADVPATKAAIVELKDQLSQAAPGIPGLNNIRRLVKGIEERFAAEPAGQAGIDLAAMDTNIKLLGRAVGALERQGGTELGAAKRLLGAMYDDLEQAPMLATGKQLPKQLEKAVALRAQAVQASKHEFAKEEVTTSISSAISSVRGEGDLITINGAKVLDRLRNLTDPASKSFDKNFAVGIEKELPAIQDWFVKVNQISGGQGKPGSLVVQGMLGAAGAGIGGAVGGVVGGSIGAFTGVALPELVSEVITSPVGREIILRGLSPTQRLITPQLLNLAYQSVRRSITPENLKAQDGQ